ncbi:MAG: hypothetical protein KDH97_03855, partial [Calditrichaeota bacterium]|nr:hypothetical protein [Calditrichota bacterium]
MGKNGRTISDFISIQHPASNIQHPASSIQHPTYTHQTKPSAKTCKFPIDLTRSLQHISAAMKNQPINPSTHQPINPSTHQPINPSTHQPI